MTRVVLVGAWETLTMPALLTGSMRIRLDGATVRLHLAGVSFPTGSIEVGVVPAMYRPSLTARRYLISRGASLTSARLTIFASGALWVADADPALISDTEVSWARG